MSASCGFQRIFCVFCNRSLSVSNPTRTLTYLCTPTSPGCLFLAFVYGKSGSQNVLCIHLFFVMDYRTAVRNVGKSYWFQWKNMLNWKHKIWERMIFHETIRFLSYDGTGFGIAVPGRLRTEQEICFCDGGHTADHTACADRGHEKLISAIP